MRYQLSLIAQVADGELIGRDNSVESVVFDSRDSNKDALSVFVAISTNNRDGHRYIEQLISCGVTSFIVEHSFSDKSLELIANDASLGFVIIDNSVDAVQRWAKHYRNSLTMPVYAITGSNGKTITKEWIVQLLPENRIFRSPKSYNSQIGVPLSLLMIRGDEEFAIIEAGISKSGEMSRLEEIIRPDGVIFTNINSAHSENFVDDYHKLLEKALICKRTKFVVYNADSEVLNSCFSQQTNLEQVAWSRSGHVSANRSANSVTLSIDGREFRFVMPFLDYGSYENIINALVFIDKLGVDLTAVVDRITRLEGVEMRLEMINGVNGCRIINDSYSNDIHSLKIALNYSSSISADHNHIVILSDFVEAVDDVYIEVKHLLSKYNISTLYTIGSRLASIGNLPFCHVAFLSTEEFTKSIGRDKFSESVILVKGSRRFSFEKIVSHIQEKMHSTVLDVDIEALIGNYKYLKSLLAPNVKSIAMVKAAAYGSGNYEIASALSDSGVDYFAVAYIDEGIALRERGITQPIIILNASQNDFNQIVSYRLEPEIYTHSQLINFSNFILSKGEMEYPVHIKLDTGMNRLGFKESDIDILCNELNSVRALHIESIFSHLSSADSTLLDRESEKQIALYDKMSIYIINELSLTGVQRHICNSAAIERFPNAHFDMVRMGISLYGIGDSKQLRLISSLRSSVLQIKDVKKGESIGYNKNGVAMRDSRIAIVSIGYADGLNRKLSSGNWSMRIGDYLVPTIGNISMDNCAVDITDTQGICEGDEVVVFDSKEDVVRIAQVVGTIPYEILTSISARIKRRYFR